MHCLGGEVRLPATWAGPHGNAFDDQESGALAETAGYILQLNFAAAAVGAFALN